MPRCATTHEKGQRMCSYDIFELFVTNANVLESRNTRRLRYACLNETEGADVGTSCVSWCDRISSGLS